MDGLQRMWEMITHTGLLDLMPTARMTRVEEQTRERQPQADATEVERDHESHGEATSAPETAETGADGGSRPELSGRMRQFARTVPEIFDSAQTTALPVEIEREETAQEAKTAHLRADNARVDGNEISASQRKRSNSQPEAEIGDRMKEPENTVPGLDARARRIRGATVGMRQSLEAPQGEAVRTGSSIPGQDSSAPEVSTDASVDGLAGRSRRWLEMSDDAVIADMIRQREASVERGR